MSARGSRLDVPDYDVNLVPEGEVRPTPAQWMGLALAGARRRKLVAVGVFLLCAAGVALYFATRTPVYRVEARILVQRQQTLASAVRMPNDDQATRTAWEVIHRRENLVSLVRQANLLTQAEGTLERAASLKPHPGAKAGGASENPDPMEEAVAILDRQLVVVVDGGTITLQIDWPDPRQAYQVVQAALQNFLEVRYVQEVTASDEAISALQGRAATLREALSAATDQARRRAVRRIRVGAPPAAFAGDDLVRLQSLLEARTRAVQDLEAMRRRRLVELEGQLAQARSTFADGHPTVVALRNDLAAFALESPQLVAMKEEEEKLRQAVDAQRARTRGAMLAAAMAATAEPEPPDYREEDPWVRDARLQYEQVVARVNAALVDLDAVRAAFKYRYEVVWPPEVPADPVSPNPVKILGLGLLASILVGLLAAAAPDLLAGRIVTRWQVERVLALPVICELKRPL